MKFASLAACAALAIAAAPTISLAETAPAAAEAPDVAHARQVLSGLITDLIAGHLNFDSMTQPLADAARPQAAGVQQALISLGAMQGLDFNGKQGEGYQFTARFEKGQTVWVIAFDAAGKISGLNVH